MSSDILAGRAARGSAVTIAAQLVRMVLQLGSVVLLARLLSPAAFGLVAMVVAITGVADLVRDFGLSLATIQAKDVSTAERSNLFWTNTALGAACAIAAVALTPVIVAIYGEPRLAGLVPPLAAVFLLSGMTTQYRADLARRMRFTAVALADLSGPALGLVAAIIFAVAGAGVWALIAQQIVAGAVTLAVAAVWGHWLPDRYDRSVPVRRFFRFGAGVFGTQLLNYATRNVDSVVIGAVWGSRELGLYSRSYQLVMVPINQINAPLTNVAVPVLARVHEDRVVLGAALRRAQMVACYVTVPVLVVVAALARPLVDVLLGSQWSAAAPILAVLALGGIFRSISQVAYWAYLATGMTSSLLRLQLWTQPIMAALIVAGVPWHGVGVAWGHLAANTGYWLVSLIAVGRATGIPVRPLMRTAATSVLVAGAPAGLAAWAVQHAVDGVWVQLALGTAAAIAAALLAVRVVPSAWRDVLTIARTLRLTFVRR